MTWQQSLVLGLLAALVVLLIQGKLRPALLFSGAVLITYLSGLADINAVVAGYTNSALLTLVLLLLVSLAVHAALLSLTFGGQGLGLPGLGLLASGDIVSDGNPHLVFFRPAC